MSLTKMICTLGKFDIPIIQKQPFFGVDLLKSNIILFGASMSGKTTFCKTLIHILHKQYDKSNERIFILDFGGALSEYKDFPLVSAYFNNSNEEYVKRMFKILEGILKDNTDALGDKNYREFKDTTDNKQPPHTTFIIDNLNAFFDEQRYLAYQEKFSKLCRDGLSKGITVVATASDTKGITSQLANFKQKIALELPEDKYTEVFNGKVGLIGNYPGHGFANVTVEFDDCSGSFRKNLPYEVQCFLPDTSETVNNEAGILLGFREGLTKKYGCEFDGITGRITKYDKSKAVEKYLTFPKPEEFTYEKYEELQQPSKEESTSEDGITVSVGLDYVNFCPVAVNIKKSNVIAIYGKRQFGKSNLLNLLLQGIIKQKSDIKVVLLDDGRKQLNNAKDFLTDIHNTLLVKDIYCKLFETTDNVTSLPFKEQGATSETVKELKMSPLQQFLRYLNEEYFTLERKDISPLYYGFKTEMQSLLNKIPVCSDTITPFTVFVIQSKFVYLDKWGKFFISNVLPQLVAMADEKGFCFIFSDVQKISDGEQNLSFNNMISASFLLDDIAGFAGERGQKTIYGNMDVKELKEDYAKCEQGDGYFYDVEADKRLKLRFIKFRKEDYNG